MKITDHAKQRLLERSSIPYNQILNMTIQAKSKGINKTYRWGIHRRNTFRCDYMSLTWIFNRSKDTLITVIKL